jgi:hypothetical protein
MILSNQFHGLAPFCRRRLAAPLQGPHLPLMYKTWLISSVCSLITLPQTYSCVLIVASNNLLPARPVLVLLSLLTSCLSRLACGRHHDPSTVPEVTATP